MRAALILVLAMACTLAPTPAAHGEDAPKAEAPKAPKLEITAPTAGQTAERVATIEGNAVGITSARLTLVLNGVPLSIAHKNGRFQTRQVLAPGWNHIRVQGQAAAKRLEDAVAVHADVPRKDLRITLTWDTPATDLDLWVTGPDGEKISYQQKRGKAGGVLDTDVTDGFGPETFTLARSQPGIYRVQVHFYGGPRASRLRVDVIEGEGTPQEGRRQFQGTLLAPGEVLDVAEFEVTPQ